MKKVTFYKSALCPRCLVVSRVLKKLQKHYPDLAVENVEVTTSIFQTFRQGIRMIPALAAQDRRLSGIILTPSKVKEFIHSLYCS